MARLISSHGRAAEAARELTRRRADLVGHGRGSLEGHLASVYEVLRAWQQPERVLLAGLLHSGYSTESFKPRLFGVKERPRVREIIGDEAEHLVFAFCACDRARLVEAAETAGAEAKLPLRGGDRTITLTRRDLGDLMVLHAANLAEQSCGPQGEPAPWLAMGQRLLMAAARCRRGVECVASVFASAASAASTFDAATEASLRASYQTLLDAPPTDAVLAPSHSPVGEPFIVAGLRALAHAQGETAAASGTRGQASLRAWGTAWDKRIGLDRWLQLSALLVRDGQKRDAELAAAGRIVSRVLERASGSPERIWAQLDALDALPPLPSPPAPNPASVSAASPVADASLPPRFAQYLGGLRTNTDRRTLEYYPGLRTIPWHDPAEFEMVADLERLAPQIASEMRAFETEHFQDEAEEIGRTGRWGVLFLLEMGRRNEAVLARCPVTASVIDKHRTVTTRGGLMYFSCLDPHTRVAPHQGPTNLRLRCHLGLEVPDGCGVRVGGVVGAWQEGRCIVFDDSFWHEAWNNSDRRRVVLIIDFWHPDLSDDEVALLAGLQRYGAANASVAERSWARNDAALQRAREAASVESPKRGAGRRR